MNNNTNFNDDHRVTGIKCARSAHVHNINPIWTPLLCARRATMFGRFLSSHIHMHGAIATLQKPDMLIDCVAAGGCCCCCWNTQPTYYHMYSIAICCIICSKHLVVLVVVCASRKRPAAALIIIFLACLREQNARWWWYGCCASMYSMFGYVYVVVAFTKSVSLNGCTRTRRRSLTAPTLATWNISPPDRFEPSTFGEQTTCTQHACTQTHTHTHIERKPQSLEHNSHNKHTHENVLWGMGGCYYHKEEREKAYSWRMMFRSCGAVWSASSEFCVRLCDRLGWRGAAHRAFVCTARGLFNSI